MKTQSYPAAWALPALLAAAGCKEGTTAPEIPEPAAITIVSGSDQIQGRGRRLHEPVVVRAEDANAAAMPGVMLTLEPGPHSGEVDPASLRTDSLGQIEVRWTLGDVAGTQTLMVSTASGSARVVVGATARPGDFDIQLVADTGFTSEQRTAIRAGLERWAAVLVNDLPDQPFPNGHVPSHHCVDLKVLEIAAGSTVDDVLLGIGIERDQELLFRSATCQIRSTRPRPLLLYLGIGEGHLASFEPPALTGFVVHTVGHLLGFGSSWGGDVWNRLRDRGEGVDTHFPDPQTVSAFDAAGGLSWDGGSKVPVENRGESWLTDRHWRNSVMGDEVMSSEHHIHAAAGLPLSAITVQSMATLGYEVDVTMADPYTVRVVSAAAMQTGALVPVRPVARPVAVEISRQDGRIMEVVHWMGAYPGKSR